jgi:hypothetical protein
MRVKKLRIHEVHAWKDLRLFVRPSRMMNSSSSSFSEYSSITSSVGFFERFSDSNFRNIRRFAMRDLMKLFWRGETGQHFRFSNFSRNNQTFCTGVFCPSVHSFSDRFFSAVCCKLPSLSISGFSN